MKGIKYYIVKSNTMSKALNFVGFSFYTFNDGEEKVYSFEDTPELREAITILSELRRKNLKHK